MHAGEPQKIPRRFIAAVALGAALIPLNSTMVAVALPAIGDSLAAEPGSLTLWLVTSYLFVNVVLQSPAGKLGDILGRRRAFMIGQALFATGTLIAVLAPYLATVAASRVLMAAGGAMLVPTAMALLRTVIPEELRPRAFGYLGALLGASAATGPLVGGLLTQYFGWKAIFLVNLPLLTLSWLLVRGENAFESGPTLNKTPPQFDFPGMALLSFSLAGVVVGMKAGGVWALGLLPLSIAGLVGLALWEQRTPFPLIDPKLARCLPFVIGGSVIGLQNLAMYALLFQLPFFFREWFGLEAGRIGQLLLTMTLCMVFFSPLGGRLAERIGTKNTIFAGLGFGLVGLFSILRATEVESLIGIAIAIGFLGSGIGLVTGPTQAAALTAVAPEQSGVAAGLLATMRYLGGIAGISIISVALANTERVDMMSQNQLCFMIYIGAYLVAVSLVFFLPGRRLASSSV